MRKRFSEFPKFCWAFSLGLICLGLMAVFLRFRNVREIRLAPEFFTHHTQSKINYSGASSKNCHTNKWWISEPIMFRYVSYQSYDVLLQCSDMFRFISESVDVVTRCSSVHCMSHVLRGNTVVDRCRPKRAPGAFWANLVHHAWIYVGLPGHIFCKLYTVALHCIPSLQLEVPSLVASISILFGAPAGRPLGVPLRPNGPSPSRLRSDAKKSWKALRASDMDF